jgi:lysophospholipase L1-like esterase
LIRAERKDGADYRTPVGATRRRRDSRLTLFRLLAFALLFCLGPALASSGAPPEPWRAEIDALVANDRLQPPPRHGVLFVGSSSIRMWTTLAADFPGVPAINRGFGGSMIADTTQYAGRIVVPYRPKLIVLYAGDNDIDGGHAPDRVLADFQAFVARVRRDLPDAAIAFVSIKPSVARARLWPRMRAANTAIARWAATQRRTHFVDVAARMLDHEGRPRPELLRDDGLHMNAAGYAIWVDALKPLLARYGFAPH